MSECASGPVTLLLRDYKGGADDAVARLLELVYSELRRIAARVMRKERAEHTLQPTALVHEAFFRLFHGEEVPFENTQQFFAASVRNMRLVLIDHARKTLAVKRTAADHPASGIDLSCEELLDIGLALDELAGHEPDAARIVELKFYGGLSIEEIAAVLGSSPRSVVRTWTWARAWLYRRLRGANGPGSAPSV